MEVLRTDLKHFEPIKDFPYQENYLDFEGMQMHYIDEGTGECILALHGEPTWSYLYRKFIPILSNYRFVAPDFIGFGKSDKIVGWKNYSYELHFRSLENFIKKMKLTEITLIVQDWGGLLGLALLAEYPDLFKRVVVLNTFLPKGKSLGTFFKIWQLFAKWHPSLPVGGIIQRGSYSKIPKNVLKAYEAPFPNAKYKGGVKAFPLLVPSNPKQSGVERMLKAREVLGAWNKPALVLFSNKDKLLGGLEKFFLHLIPTAKQQPNIPIKDAGHFLQEEKGEEIANYIALFMEDKLKDKK